MTRKTMLLVAAGGATLAIALWATRDASPDSAPVKNPTADTTPTAPTPAPQQAPPPTEKPAPGTQLLMPDGTEVKPLNGVTNPPKALWGDRPYSPIVKVTRTTIDWYQHADGSLTTTLEVWRKDLGRMDAVTMVCNPTDVAPLEIDGKIIPLPERKGSGH